jgi:hypothetical protein
MAARSDGGTWTAARGGSGDVAAVVVAMVVVAAAVVQVKFVIHLQQIPLEPPL